MRLVSSFALTSPTMASVILTRRLLASSQALARSNYLSKKVSDNSEKWIQSRGFSDRFAIKGPGPTTRLILIAGGTFSLTALGSKFYDDWKLEQSRSDSLKKQLMWDVEKQKFKPSEFKLFTSDVDLEKVAAAPVSRHVPGPIKLPGNTNCPYCCKVRAFLNYYGIEHDIVEVNPVSRRQIKFSKYRKVPILVLSRAADSNPSTSPKEEEELVAIDKVLQLNDSTLIVSVLGTYLLCNPELKDTINSITELYQPVSFHDPEKNKDISEVVNKYFLMKGDIDQASAKAVVNKLSEERKWRAWCDDVLLHAVAPNLYRTWNESVDSFKAFSKDGEWDRIFSAWERFVVVYVGAVAMRLVAMRVKSRYRLKDDVRESLYDYCRTWTKAIGGQRQFMGGDAPNLADLAVFGVLNSMECNKSAFDDMLKNTNIGKWYFAVKEACNKNAGHHELLKALPKL